MEKVTLSAKEAASLLGVSYWAVLEAAKQNRIPNFRIGKRVLFRIESLQEWMENQESQSVKTELDSKSYGEISRVEV